MDCLFLLVLKHEFQTENFKYNINNFLSRITQLFFLKKREKWWSAPLMFSYNDFQLKKKGIENCIKNFNMQLLRKQWFKVFV